LNATEFNNALAEKLGITQTEAGSQIKSVIGIMKGAFDKGKNISILKFGTFAVKKIEPRKGFSPVLGKYVIFPPKQILEFHASESLREKVKNIETE